MSHGLGAGDARAVAAAWSCEVFREQKGIAECLLRYLEGWADANPLKILDATG